MNPKHSFKDTWVASVTLAEFKKHCAEDPLCGMNEVDAEGYWNKVHAESKKKE